MSHTAVETGHVPLQHDTLSQDTSRAASRGQPSDGRENGAVDTTSPVSHQRPAAADAPPDVVGADMPAEKRSPTEIATVMACLCACVFVAALDVTIVTTALPTIAAHFASSSGYTWIGTAFILAHTATTPSWGKVSDIWGRKPIMLGANAIFFAGSLTCALVDDIGAFIAGRAIQGVGAGGMQTMVNICISDMFSERDRGVYYGLTSVVWAVASGIGPVMGGVFTTKLSWKWCFWINLPITGAVFILLYFTLKLPSPNTPIVAGLKAVDWTGSFLIVGGTLTLLIGLDLGGVYDPWHSATVVCLLVFGFVAGGLFIVNEWKFAKYPIIPVQLFHLRSSAAAYAVCFFHAFAFMGVAYYMPMYFQAVLLASPLTSGVYLLPFILSSSIVAALTGVFIQKTGKYMPAVYAGLGIMTLGIGLLIDVGIGQNWGKIVAFQIIAGGGVGMNFEGPLLAVQAVVPSRDVAVATTTMGFIRTISTAVSVVIGGVVFQNQMDGKKTMLEDALGTDIARAFDGVSASANVEAVKTLPPGQRDVARTAYYESIRTMWIVYTALSFVGLLLGSFIRGHHLSKDHKEAKLGLYNDDQQTRAEQSSILQDQSGSGYELSAITRRA